MKIGSRIFDTKEHTYIMGILNVTPDSFSDGGKYNGLEAAFRRTEEMITEGADIIDVGGESTRPGYQMISDQEEIDRVLPVIEGIKKRFDIPVSVDTYKSQVAEAAIGGGVDLINDIWGLVYDPKMAGLIGETGVACCLMHNREKADYQDFITDFLQDMKHIVELARQGGIADDKIILDPGVGFGKSYENNLEVINRLEELNVFGYPVLLGTSRKSVIDKTLNLPANDRVEGTITTTVMGVERGCGFVRVHDIKENKRAILMTEAVLGKGKHGQD